jgi:hypothetical protein
MEKSLKFDSFIHGFDFVSAVMTIGSRGAQGLEHSRIMPPLKWYKSLPRLREFDASDPPAVGVAPAFDGHRS